MESDKITLGRKRQTKITDGIAQELLFRKKISFFEVFNKIIDGGKISIDFNFTDY
ncbi:hypothetical protein CAPN002_13070 [Capnocytophaga stomatis]|nr:hypothetical protein CAPN002_13070 [Capnocytophaga stomatis]